VQTESRYMQAAICILDTRSPLTIRGDKLRGYDDLLRIRKD